MKKHTLTRALSLILVLAMFCSLLVLPAAAADATADLLLRFTKENGDALTSTIKSGETIMARLVPTNELEINQGTFNLRFDTDVFAVKKFGRNNDKYAANDSDGGYLDNNYADGNILLVYSSANPERFGGQYALMYFYLTAKRDVSLSELPSLMAFQKPNGTTNDSSFVELFYANGDSSNVKYNCTWNVCPCISWIGYDQNKLNYHNNTHVSDLKEALSIQAYTVAGELSYRTDSIKIYPNADSDTPLADSDLLYYIDMKPDATAENVKGTFYVEVTTTDGVTLGKELNVTIPMDTADHIEVTPAAGGYQYDYVYTDEGHKGFQLKPGSYNVVFVYKSGTRNPATGSVSCSYASIGDDEITLTHDDSNLSAKVPFTRTEKYAIDVPEVSGCNYTGTVQTAPITTSAYYTVGGTDKATDAGEYTATLALTDPTNVCWSDTKNSDNRDLTWKIAPATNYLTIVPGSATIYESTTVEQICALSNNYLKKQGSQIAEMMLGTVMLYKDSDCRDAYANADKLPKGEKTVYYKFTPNDSTNYAEVTGKLTLNVQEREIVSIRLQAGHETPDITQYYYRDSFTSRGLVIEAVYKDGGTGELDLADFEWSDLNTVGKDVTVTGTLKGTNFKVEVSGIKVDRRPISVTVKLVNESDKRLVYDGTDREPEVKVTFQITAGKTEELTLGSDYTVSYNRNKNVTSESLPAEILVTSVDTSNYNISGKPMALFYIDPKPVTISGVQSANKPFDGTTTASVSGSVQIVGKVGNDDVSVTDGAANFDSAFVDATKVVFSNFSLSGTAAKNYTLEKQPDPVSAKITPKALTLTGLTVEKTKQYDGTNVAAITNWGTLDGIVKVTQNGAQVTYGAEIDKANSKATFDSAAVGPNKTITFSTFKLKEDRYSANYTVDTPSPRTGEITQRNVDKSDYNFGTVTVIKGKGEFTDPTFTTAINSSDVSITTGDLTYKVGETNYTHAELVNHLKTLDKDATVNATVSATATGNFFGSVSGTITFNVVDIIFKQDGKLVGASDTVFQFKDGENANVYNAGKAGDYLKINGTLTASVDGKDIKGRYYFVFDDKGESDKVAPAGQNHTFKLLFDSTTEGYSYTGVQVGAAWTDRYIRPATVTVGSGVEVASKVYDGTTAATVSTENAVINGKLGNDELTLTPSNAVFADKNAGKNKQVTVRLTLDGADAGNYKWSESDDPARTYQTTGEITPKNVTITGMAVEASKTYDGKVSATSDATNAKINGKIDDDKVEIAIGNAKATYADKNVGTDKTVTFSGFALTGADAGNYNLTAQPASVQANITAKELRITNFTVKDKVYDGNDIAEIVSIATDAVEGDDVKCSNAIARFVASGTFSASDAQNGKQVTLEFPQGVILAGADKNNYTFDKVELANDVTANIAKANLTGAPTFTKITQSGKKLGDLQNSDVDLTAIHGVSGEPNPLYPVLTWGEDRNTVIQPNKSYSWTIDAGKNYNVLTGSVVLYPVSTGYSEQVKKQIEEFEAKKRGELPESDTTFRDVSEDDYFFDAVNWAAENGITGGVSANRFGPTQDCSRGQTMTFLWRAMGEPEPASRASDLTDVMTGSYYYDAVLWAMEAGITTGAGANRFAPNATVTRGQFVTFLYRLANASSDGVHPFTDVPAGSYYEKAIAWAYAEGITNGTSATTFSPDAPCTRAQIITFLYRYFNR